MLDFLQYPLALIVTLGVLVTIHELGHFVIARWSGVKVVRFSVGYGKPIWSFTDKRGTEFAIAAIPLGGYLSMLDERSLESGGLSKSSARGDGAQNQTQNQTTEVAHNQLSAWWRMAIAFGGPLANFLLAVFVYWWLFVAGTTSFAPMLGAVPVQSVAGESGLQLGMQITAVDGKPTNSWQQIAMALAGRLGDTGSVEISARKPGPTADRQSAEIFDLPIQAWHQGVDEPQLLDSLGIKPGWPALIGEVLAEGAGARAGLQAWDEIVEFNDEAVTGWQTWVEAVQQTPEQTIQVVVRRNGELRSLTITPFAKSVDGGSIGYVGVAPYLITSEFGVLDAVRPAIDETVDKTLMTLGLLKKMVFGQVSMKNLSGPITIAKVAGDSARASWRMFVGILALLSISLAVLNLLPIPILDGGHIVYCLAEIVSGKPVPERVQIVGTQVGLVIVSSMMLLAIFNDITRFL